MSYRCEYCQSPCGDAETHCQNCGAPLTHAAPQGTDFRICPFCSHRLLALGSPACSYCGHRLPDEYIKAREAEQDGFVTGRIELEYCAPARRAAAAGSPIEVTS